jgi:hypothetical protein
VSKKEEMPAPAAAGCEKKPVEHWAELHNTPSWIFEATKASAFRNIEGFETTEQGYLSAVQHTLNTPCGYTSQGVWQTLKKHREVDPTDLVAVAEYAKCHIRKAGKQ